MDREHDVIPASEERDLTPERDATPLDLRKYDDAEQAIRELDTSGTFEPSNPSHRLYAGAFDGTSNDDDGLHSDSRHTKPGILERPFRNHVLASPIAPSALALAVFLVFRVRTR